MQQTSIKGILTTSTEQLSDVSDSPALDSELLLLFALNKYHPDKNYQRASLRINADELLDRQVITLFKQLVKFRIAGKPIAYLLGKQDFWTLELAVNEYTLIPRPETETLVEQVLALVTKDQAENILDLGTGSGAIALAIAKERPNCQVFAVDKSIQALKVAKQNAINAHIENCFFICSNWLAGLKKNSFDIIVSNPPYIKENDPHLSKLSYEPISALVSADNGLFDIQKICTQSIMYLHSGGDLLIEHGYDQAEQVKQLFRNNHYQNLQQFKDLSGITRLTMAQKQAMSQKKNRKTIS